MVILTKSANAKLEDRFDGIRKNPNTVHVESRDHLITEKNVYSDGFAECTGVVLMNGNHIGVSHYIGGGTYLVDMINELLEMCPEQHLTGVIISGYSPIFINIRNTLRQQNIKVVGTYLDYYGSKDIPLYPRLKGVKRGVKSLVASPSTREVIVYSSTTGYKQLSPQTSINSFFQFP